MKNQLKLTTLLLLAFLTGVSQHQTDTTHSAKTTSNILLEQILNLSGGKDLKNDMVRMETVEFPPGYSSMKHTHPCPLFVYVLEGELLSEFEGKKNIYKTGDTFYEKPNGLHSITKNNSTTRTTKILVIYFMKEGMNTFLPTDH